MCISFLIKNSNSNNGVADILEKLRQNEGQEVRLNTRKIRVGTLKQSNQRTKLGCRMEWISW